MKGRFWISVIVLFVVSMGMGFVVHGMLLRGDYMALPSLMRSDEDSQHHFVWMLLAHLMMAAGFTWIYRKGHEPSKPPVTQGVRFGLAVAVMSTIPVYLIYYAVQPWPGAVVVKQIVFDGIAIVLLGVVVALLNRGPKTT